MSLSRTDKVILVLDAMMTHALRNVFESFQYLLIIIALIISFTFFVGIANPTAARPVIAAAGYTNIKVSDTTKVFGCDSRDLYHTEFWATGQNGASVHGVVCASIFKGSTIRML